MKRNSVELSSRHSATFSSRAKKQARHELNLYHSKDERRRLRKKDDELNLMTDYNPHSAANREYSAGNDSHVSLSKVISSSTLAIDHFQKLKRSSVDCQSRNSNRLVEKSLREIRRHLKNSDGQDMMLMSQKSAEYSHNSMRRNQTASERSRDSVNEKLKSLAIESNRMSIAERSSNVDRPYNSKEVTKVSQST